MTNLTKSILCIGCAFLFSASLFAQDKGSEVLSNALKFLDVPYAAHTLDVNDKEELVINCDEMDCTTFVEYALAYTLSPKIKGDVNEEVFGANVQKIRYRDGKINGYASRLHYITEWIENGVKSGLFEDITKQYSPYCTKKKINYMTSHANQYKQLKNSADQVNAMRKIEQYLSEKEYCYIPKDKLPVNGMPWIKNGDVLAITTDTPGLDICHLGIAFYVQGKLCLLHASSSAGKVLVSRVALSHMLKKNSKWTGIRVIRLK